MKKFNFRLESVLKYRTYQEQLAQQEMLKAFIKVAESEKRVEALKNILLNLSERLDKETGQGISAASFKQFSDYLDSLEDDIQSEIKNLNNLKKTADEKQKILTEKSIERKIIERLKNRKKDDYREEMLVEEQNTADEVSSLKTARGQNETF